MPAEAFSRALVSRSVATIVTGGVKFPYASTAVIASEYGSSPVDAAQHQMLTDMLDRLRRSRKRVSSAKWCGSRKNDVRFVVSALTKDSHSGLSWLSSNAR